MNTNRPLMLGIVGDSGAGKTTLTRGVVRILGHNGVTPICLDDYHRYSRAERAARGLTAADPSANDLSLMAEHLATLRTGGTIQKPVYDHRSGELRAPEAVAATGLVIAYGMLTLTPLHMASLFDLTVFLDPDDTLHHVWKLNRDTAERGYAAEQVLALRRANDDAAMRYVSVQRRYANLVIRFHAPRDAQLTSGSLPLTVDLLFRHTPALLLLEPILEFIGQQALRGIRISRGIIDEDGCTSDRLSI
ncbi:MAG: phosphoribulokinase, partial [Oscillochloris sp.]|nr:phosphoribulokinase [Oscillochloris sp.]